MIETPFRFEDKITDEEFQKLGRFLTRWAMIEHILANCLRSLLNMDPKAATVMIFPLSFDLRFKNIEEIAKYRSLNARAAALLSELKPLITAMQYIRNTVVHGVIMDFDDGTEPVFQLRSKGRILHKADLLQCEDLINYTSHITQALRLSLGDKDSDKAHLIENLLTSLPDRPPLPDFLPPECRKFPFDDKVERASLRKA